MLERGLRCAPGLRHRFWRRPTAERRRGPGPRRNCRLYPLIPALHKNKKARKSAKSRKRGQQKIDSSRAREIQEALIREHYLDGTASGTWDAKSQSAMQRYQSDNGWQSKTVPDSRALIKLGLGPNHDHLLNPESAMTSQPEPLHAEPMLEQTSNMTTQPQK